MYQRCGGWEHLQGVTRTGTRDRGERRAVVKARHRHWRSVRPPGLTTRTSNALNQSPERLGRASVGQRCVQACANKQALVKHSANGACLRGCLPPSLPNKLHLQVRTSMRHTSVRSSPVGDGEARRLLCRDTDHPPHHVCAPLSARRAQQELCPWCGSALRQALPRTRGFSRASNESQMFLPPRAAPASPTPSAHRR